MGSVELRENELNAEKAYQQIVQRLNQLRVKQKIQRMFSGFLYTLTLICFTLLILGWLESTFWFSTTWRAILLIAFFITVLSSAGLWIFYRGYRLVFRRQTPSDDSLALMVGRQFHQIKDRLIDALQVFCNHQKAAFGTSSDLARASLLHIEKEIQDTDFKEAAPWSKVFQRFRLFVPLWAALILLGFIFIIPLRSAWLRLGHPNKDFIKPMPYQLILHPGDIQVVQGERVEIVVETKGDLPTDVILKLQEADQSAEEKVLKKPFRYRLPVVRNTLHYSAQCGEVGTPTYTIDVVQRPLIRSLQVRLFPPIYSRLRENALDSNDGHIHVLKGTRVQLHALANKWISQGVLSFDQNAEKKLTVSQNQLSGYFTVDKEDRYRIRVLDSLGLENINPISYSIHLQEDLYPLSRIVYPKTSQDLDESMQAALTLEGEDDFGISKMRLAYWVHPSGERDTTQNTPDYQDLLIDKNEPKNVLLNHTWDLTDLGLFPEDVVSYALEVWDNDRISGPKMTRSQIKTLRFPSIYEIFQEVEQEQAYQTENLSEIYQESQAIQEDLDQLAREMKSGEEMKWEDREALDDMAEKQKDIEENLQSLQKDLEDMVQRMVQFDMLNPETLEKYQELQELYQEIGSQELFEAMKKLRENLKEMNQDALQQAMDQLQLSQEQFVKAMERTISLLKRIQIEQKVEELVQRIEDLAERQGSLNQQLNQQDKTNIPAMQQNQKSIQKDTDALRNEMDDLHSKMEEVPNMPVPQLDKIMEKMDQEDLQNQMETMQERMKSGKLGQAGEKGAGVQQSMMSLSDMLKMLQKSIQQSQKSQIAKGMRRIMYRLLHLSHLQESLSQSLTRGEMMHREGARKQLSLISGLSQAADSLIALSHQTFFVSPKMGMAISDASRSMRQALTGLQQAGARGVYEQQNRAMGGLNRCVLALQDAMNKMASSASGLGMEDFMMQMEKMAQQQQGINQQTMDMLNQGQMSLQEQAAMSRLMAEQSALKKALERMMDGMKSRSDIQRRMGQMGDDMKEVIQDFQNRTVRRETIQRQQRILSRLLDAQHSIKKRDFSQRREARTGVDVARKSPNALDQSDNSWKEKMRRDVLRLGEEGYTKAYQEWIRYYFEALSRE